MLPTIWAFSYSWKVLQVEAPPRGWRCWLSGAVCAGWGWRPFLTMRRQRSERWLSLPFMNDFFAVCDTVWQHFTHSTTSLKTRVSPLKPFSTFSTKFMPCSQSFVVTHRSHSIFTRSRAISQGCSLCSSIRRPPCPFDSALETAVMWPRLRVPLLILRLSLFPPHLQFLPPLKSWPIMVILEGWNQHSPNSCLCSYFDLFPWITNIPFYLTWMYFLGVCMCVYKYMCIYTYIYTHTYIYIRTQQWA